MDQRKMYELQSVPEITPAGNEEWHGIKGRNEFIVSYLKNLTLTKTLKKIHIAELSFGDGSLTQALLGASKLFDLTCADISSIRIQTLNKLAAKAPERVHLVECNFDTQFNLLNSNAFDVVLALDIMEHVFDVFNFMEHCRRILHVNGIFVLRVPNIAYVRHRLNLLFGKMPVTASWFGKKGDIGIWKEKWGWDGSHLHLFTIPLLVKLLKDYGFNVLLCRDPGTRLEHVRNLWPTLMYANPVLIAKRQ